MYADPGKMQFKLVNMRPELAEQFLAKLHPKQRRPKPRKVDLYAADMAAGEWRLTHQAIGVDTGGWTMDGQNRLRAVIKAGVVVPMWVCYNVPDDGAMENTDTGANRNVNDAAKVRGLDFSNKSYASVARRMADGMKGANRSKLSIEACLDFISDHEDGLKFCFEALSSNVKGVTQASVRAVVARAYYSKPKKRLLAFGQMLVDGLIDDRNTDSAVITLRNWLLEPYAPGRAQKRHSATFVYGVAEQCLDAFLKKQRVFKLEPAERELFLLPGENEKSSDVNPEDQP